MHMADALISPAVGGGLWVAAALTLRVSAKKLERNEDNSRVPLMGVLAAFIFAAQMINIAIPGTGASGHLGGGVLLAMLLGPHAAFIVMASILTIQAFFFADGGLLALGCNMINLGFIPAFIAYPLIYRRYAQHLPLGRKHTVITTLTTLFALQLGALAVVIQTTLSGISSLDIGHFLLLMQPIHLAIGIGESLITVCVFNLIATTQPLHQSVPTRGRIANKRVFILALSAIFIGGGLSPLASSQPDGLEWSVEQVITHSNQIAQPSPQIESETRVLHQQLDNAQTVIAPFPDYAFRRAVNDPSSPRNSETATSGLIGGGLCALLIFVSSIFMRRKCQPTASPQERN